MQKKTSKQLNLTGAELSKITQEGVPFIYFWPVQYRDLERLHASAWDRIGLTGITPISALGLTSSVALKYLKRQRYQSSQLPGRQLLSFSQLANHGKRPLTTIPSASPAEFGGRSWYPGGSRGVGVKATSSGGRGNSVTGPHGNGRFAASPLLSGILCWRF